MASALAIAGSSLGMALGYVIPSLIVTNFNVNSDFNSTYCENCTDEVVDLSSRDITTLKNQILILVSISTGISILNLLGMLIIYDRDPILAPNQAERRRSTAVQLVALTLSQFPKTTHQKIKDYLKSVNKIIFNNNCRYLLISQRNNSITQIEN